MGRKPLQSTEFCRDLKLQLGLSHFVLFLWSTDLELTLYYLIPASEAIVRVRQKTPIDFLNVYILSPIPSTLLTHSNETGMGKTLRYVVFDKYATELSL